MSKEIENYYRRHFGAFEHLTLADIDGLYNYEQGLQQLPVTFYKEPQHLAVFTNPHHLMQDVLQNILRIHIN
jgi:hypothetical protein